MKVSIHQFLGQALLLRTCNSGKTTADQLERIESWSPEHHVIRKGCPCYYQFYPSMGFFYRKVLKDGLKKSVITLNSSVFTWEPSGSLFHLCYMAVQILDEKWLPEFRVCAKLNGHPCLQIHVSSNFSIITFADQDFKIRRSPNAVLESDMFTISYLSPSCLTAMKSAWTSLLNSLLIWFIDSFLTFFGRPLLAHSTHDFVTFVNMLASSSSLLSSFEFPWVKRCNFFTMFSWSLFDVDNHCYDRWFSVWCNFNP